MRSLKSPWKDWRRRRLLVRHGVRPEPVGDVFRAGERSGTWAVRRAGLGPDSVVVSVGVGDNIAWDLAMAAEFGCQVHLCDPTPVSTAWLARQELPEGVHHHPVAIAARDGTLSFKAPRRAGGVNFRPLEPPLPPERSVPPEHLEPNEPGAPPEPVDLTAPCERLSTLAARLGVERFDVLKLDIEGGELQVLPDLLAAGPAVGQLLVEFHHRHDGRDFARTLEQLRALEAHGFRLFDVSRRGLELSFHRG